MLLYLTLAYERRQRAGHLRSRADLREAIVDGAAKRLRPKLMTVATMFLGLLPVLWSTGAGADVMKRIAAPMIGGLFSSFLLELSIYPALFAIWKGRGLPEISTGPLHAAQAGTDGRLSSGRPSTERAPAALERRTGGFWNRFQESGIF